MKQFCSTIYHSILYFLETSYALFYSLLFGRAISNKLVVLKMDGGVCSQMHFYLIGMLLQEKGYDVKFDLTWFRKNAKDCNGVFARNFDLLKIFPSLPFSEPSKSEMMKAKCHVITNDYFSNKTSDSFAYLHVKSPCFLQGYFRDPTGLYTVEFNKYFKVSFDVLDETNKKMLKDINDTNAIAIHVRRGDLATYNSAYGDPCDVDYFQNAINYVHDIAPETNKLFFFSDEPSWVVTTLLPKMKIRTNLPTCVVDINGSDRGYMDILLMSACQYIISSNGSVGKFAYLLSQNAKMLICRNNSSSQNEMWRQLKNVKFI